MFSLKSHEKRKEKTKRRGRHEAVQTAVGFGTSEIRQAAKGRRVRGRTTWKKPDRTKIFRWQGVPDLQRHARSLPYRECWAMRQR